jgi:hypothetical protein
MNLELNTEDVLQGPFGNILDDSPYLLIKLVFNYISLWRIAEGLEEFDEGSFDGFYSHFDDLMSVWKKDHNPPLEEGAVLVRWSKG